MAASVGPGGVGIIAGAGDLPRLLADACRSAGRAVHVLALEGHAEAGRLEGLPVDWVRLGAGARAIEILKTRGCEELVFAGAVRRPTLAELRPDFRAAAFLARAGFAALGDDGVMRAVVREFEREGFRVVGVDDLLGDVLAPEGVLGAVEPDAAALEDIARGLAVALALGRADAGQGVVVQGGVVLAIEAAEGTDALLARAGGLRREGPGGVFVKTAKPGQERRIDLPTVGLATLRGAMAAGLRGVAMEAGRTILLERTELVAEADAAGLFVIGIRANEAGDGR